MAETATVLLYLSAAAAIGGTAVSVLNANETEKERQRQLKIEKKNAELAALDARNENLKKLNAANSDQIANAGNLDPFASMSLLAGRAFNFREAENDDENITTNLATTRAQIATKISLSKRRQRTAKTVGILQSITIGTAAGSQISQLGKPATPVPSGTTPPKKTKKTFGGP